MKFVIKGYEGQGVRTLSRILSRAGSLAGFYANDFSSSKGSIRQAYVRLSKDPVIEKGPLSNPDIIIILDSALFNAKEAKADEQIIINVSPKSKAVPKQKNIHCLDALEIVFKNTGKAMPNTAMAGAVTKYHQKIQIKHVKSAIEQELTYKPKENALAAEEASKVVK